MKTMPISEAAKAGLFSEAAILNGLSMDAVAEMAALSFVRRYSKNEIIFQANEPCEMFFLVADGLVRVSRYSTSGKRLTYLLAGRGEPIDLIRPFTGERRENEGEAVKESILVHITRKDFLDFAFRHPQLILNIVGTLGQAVDSSNSRILDMLDRKVVGRLKRVLHSLHNKFGAVLNFTATDIAELAGTTTESSLRIMSRLCQEGIIEKRRGKIRILQSGKLKEFDEEAVLWL